jgi:hypothetical protein
MKLSRTLSMISRISVREPRHALSPGQVHAMKKVLQVTAVFWRAASLVFRHHRQRQGTGPTGAQSSTSRSSRVTVQANACSSSTSLAERTPSKPNGLVGGLMVSQVLTLSAIPVVSLPPVRQAK